MRSFTKLVALYREVGNLEGEVRSSSNLAECHHAAGRTADAIAVARGALPFAESASVFWQGGLHANLAAYLAWVSDIDGARVAARTAIQISSTEPESPIGTNALDHYALVIALDHDCERAARLVGYCNATRAANHFVRQYTELQTYDRVVAILESEFLPHELEQLFADGASLSPSAAMELALLADQSS